jgi:HEAT repeat protein
MVGSPIPAKAEKKMNDAQWLSALAKYAGVEHRYDRAMEASGGERQLAYALEENAKADTTRFVVLSAKMPPTLPAAYWDAIIRGVAAGAPPTEPEASVLLSGTIGLLERVHALPGRPCGRWIAHLVGNWSKVEWPLSVIDAVRWYATDDPDPQEEVWRKAATSGQDYFGGEPDMAGLNSTRGAAANAIARLLFADPTRANVLIETVEHLAQDGSIAVRSQAIHALLALLDKQPARAIHWFIECLSVDPVLLGVGLVESFVHHAGYRDYVAIRPIVQQMLASEDADIVKAGANVCCLLALHVDAALLDAVEVRAGAPTMREAAAKVYATKVAHKEVGAACRDLLLPFFDDPDQAVRKAAAAAFHRISDLEIVAQDRLLLAFLDGRPGAAALEPVIRALEDSPVSLPSLVCRLVELGVEAFRTDGGDIRTHSAIIAADLSKIVIRLYAQSSDEEIRTRCLNAIDKMERANFFGLSDELGRVER